MCNLLNGNSTLASVMLFCFVLINTPASEKDGMLCKIKTQNCSDLQISKHKFYSRQNKENIHFQNIHAGRDILKQLGQDYVCHCVASSLHLTTVCNCGGAEGEQLLDCWEVIGVPFTSFSIQDAPNDFSW